MPIILTNSSYSAVSIIIDHFFMIVYLLNKFSDPIELSPVLSCEPVLSWKFSASSVTQIGVVEPLFPNYGAPN